jgi:predicted O-methyltransferase YrrM
VARTLVRQLRLLLSLRRLPWRVALFQIRARRLAARTGDDFSLISATRPGKLLELLQLAFGRPHVVELGTATGWTAISLALSDPNRHVTTYDPIERPERERYLSLVPASVRHRISFVSAPGAVGPSDAQPVDLLYLDSSHERDETIREFEAWRRMLHASSVIAFDDYGHPEYPGVREAVKALQLRGEDREGLFVVICR